MDLDGILSFTLENDVFTGSDNDYTNGWGLSWSTLEASSYDEESFVRGWTDFWSFLPFVGDPGYRTFASWSLVQEMHTPADIEQSPPDPNDRPYAGVLVIDSVLHARSEEWSHFWNLRLGVVGEASMAEEFQKTIHEWIDSAEPRGWDSQLEDEPVLNFDYKTGYILIQDDLDESLSWRVVPIGGLNVGTYLTAASLGAYGEIGWNLQPTFGYSTLRSGLTTASVIGSTPRDEWSLAFTAGGGGYAVAHFLPLDGNVFRNNDTHVDSEPLVGYATFGVQLKRGRFALGFSFASFTEAFEGQGQDSEFGSLTLGWFL